MATTHVATAELRRLGPEPWGSRLRRARETHPANPSQIQLAQWVAALTMRPIAGSTISRLESLDEVPDDRSRRSIAYLLSILCEVDPAELDLTDNDGGDQLMVHRLREAALDITANTDRYSECELRVAA